MTTEDLAGVYLKPAVMLFQASLFAALLSGPATAQLISTVEVYPRDQVVICDAPETRFDDILFSQISTKERRVFFSTFEEDEGEQKPVLTGIKGKRHSARKVTLYIMSEATALEGGCVPMKASLSEELIRSVDEARDMEAFLSSTDSDFRSAAEASWCQPVYVVNLVERAIAYIHRVEADASQMGIPLCVDRFKTFIDWH